MTLLANHPLTTTFAGVSYLQALGDNPTGDASPTGVANCIEIDDENAKVTLRDTDVDTFGERRSEMVFSHSLDPTGERWYTWDFMIPSSWGTTDGSSMAVMQIHETPDEGAPSVAVQFVLLMENGQLVARVPSSILTEAATSYRMARRPIEFGRWYSLCLHANWQTTAIGFWELFVDGYPMFKQYNLANAYTFAVGGYLKLGIYNFGATENWGTKIAYFRDVSVWSGNDGYQTVMGTVPLAPVSLLAP